MKKYTESGPMEIKVKGESAWICRCGLTNNEPFCDNSHEACQNESENEFYEYLESGERIKLKKE